MENNLKNCITNHSAIAHQTPLSMESSRQEYWSGLPCPSLKSTAVQFLKRIFIKFIFYHQLKKTKNPSASQMCNG